jgi:hypothetical protein
MNKGCCGPFPNGASNGLIENPLTGKSRRLVDSAALVLKANAASVNRKTIVLIMLCLSVCKRGHVNYDGVRISAPSHRMDLIMDGHLNSMMLSIPAKSFLDKEKCKNHPPAMVLYRHQV